MTAPAVLATVYCTDEQLAIRCETDFSVLTPNSNAIASGTDGVFSSTDRWTLTSATNDFGAQGVVVGHTFRLKSSGPGSPFGSTTGMLFAVGAVAGSSVTLRRLGLGDGVGMPPSPAAGLTGVAFVCETLAPQIEQASDEINRRFNLDPAASFNTPTNIYDLRELREACMLIVLVRKYVNDVRTKDGAYQIKIADLIKARESALARLQLRWGSDPNADPTPAPMFTTRLHR